MVFISPLAVVFSLTVAAHAFTSQLVSPPSNPTETQPQSLPVSPFVLSLSKTVRRHASKAAALRQVSQRSGKAAPGLAVLEGTHADQEYVADITVGGQKFKVLIDTGSSDLWLVHRNFNCYSLLDEPQSETNCNFGSSGFNPSASKTFKLYANHNFNTSYSDGEFLTGIVGFDTVELGGLSVLGQEIGVVTDAAWFGDGVSTGLLGLCYPSITSVFTGTDPNADGQSNLEPYSSFFLTAIKEGLVSQPVFSIALNRGSIKAENNSTDDPNLGYLALGGVAPVDTTNNTVTVPFQMTQIFGNKTTYEFFTVNIDAYMFPGSKKLTTKGTSIIDTGTAIMYLPTEIADALAADFKPPAMFSDDVGGYIVACNATAPAFSVVIGGVHFPVSAKDLIVPFGVDENGKQFCIGGWDDGGEAAPDNFFVLGETFLHNVVATFNLKSNKITLRERAPY